MEHPHRTITARLDGVTVDAVRLRDGTHAAWFPRALLDTAGRRAVDGAAIGDRVTVGVQAWKLDELRWPHPRDTATPDLFEAPKS